MGRNGGHNTAARRRCIQQGKRSMTDITMPSVNEVAPGLAAPSPSTKRLKVLISAYLCTPNSGSEAGIGWNWVEQIARHHDVHVILNGWNQSRVDPYVQEHPTPNVKWIYYDLPGLKGYWDHHRKMRRVYYYAWQFGAYLFARRLHKKERYDIAHHITLGTFWMPSLLSLLPIPFVWGPVGGGETAPRRFYKSFGRKGHIFEILRDIGRWRSYWDPFVRLTASRADKVIVTSEQTAQKARRLGASNPEVFSQVAIPLQDSIDLGQLAPHNGGPFRLVSIGRLLHWKGFHLALEAFARLHKELPDSEYWIIGDGRDRPRLESLAASLGLQEKVKFWGQVPRAKVLELLADCDVVIHPSLHESGGWVIAEGQAAGRPVICLDLGGPALQVSPETGVKVPAHTPDQVVADLARELKRLADNPDLRAQMGEAGKQLVREDFTWDTKSQRVLTLYQQLIKQNAAAK